MWDWNAILAQTRGVRTIDSRQGLNLEDDGLGALGSPNGDGLIRDQDPNAGFRQFVHCTIDLCPCPGDQVRAIESRYPETLWVSGGKE